MIKRGFRRNSIMVRLLFSMLAVLLIQTFLFAGNIWYGGTIEELNNSSVDLLRERVFSRKNYLQNEMIQRWSNLSKFEHDIQTAMDSFLQEKEITLSTLKQEPNLAFEFLERTVNDTIFALRQRMVTGAFILLMGENGKGHPGVYIRDSDPLFNPADNSDLRMEIGPSAVARKADISLGLGWSPGFTLSEGDDSAGFYYKPLKAAQEYSGDYISDLGYWSRPFMLSEYGLEAITYSIPLRDIEGNPYGVIGVDLTLDYLRKMLYYDEIAENKQGAYLLATTHGDDMFFENVISSGPMFNKIFGDSSQTVFDEKTKYNNIYRFNKGKSNRDTVYGCVHYLDLYNSNTPFEMDRWALIGIVEEPILFKSARKIMLYVAISLFLSFIVGTVGVVLAGVWVVKPITKLVRNVRSSDPEKSIILGKTNIVEIDDLAWSIETLSNKVADSADKLSKIIGMVEMPIGAFEHNLNEYRVFCTDAFFDLAGIERIEKESEYISSAYFYEILKGLQRNPEPDLEDIYRCDKRDGTTGWLRIKIQENNGKMLGVMEDVTGEVKEKRKIEYERDHDLLTHLLNRRAFQVEVSKLLRQEDVKTAALVMWDLDNLKYINDTYGHDFGDQYIKETAETLSEIMIYNGIIARMSGDEFYAFIYGYEDKREIIEIVEMIQEKLYNTTIRVPNGTNIRIRASAGIAWYPVDSKDYHELIKYADFAMYEVKNKEKGSIGEFDKESYNEKSFLLHGKEELNRFIDEELADFVFQPIVDAQNGSVFAYEALMRPKIATLISPKDIIILADSQSKLYDIERITLFKAMEAFQREREAFGDAKIFINSIANHVLSDRDLKRFEDKYKSDLHRIVIEIIENEQANERITKKKQDMAARWNSHLALDDFGAGYNSEIALLTLSPTFVKLDMTIIRGIEKDLNRQKLFKTLVQYIKDRKIKIIAEGVETKAEMDTLIEFGVDYMQGYYIGEPSMVPKKISPKIVNEICQR